MDFKFDFGNDVESDQGAAQTRVKSHEIAAASEVFPGESTLAFTRTLRVQEMEFRLPSNISQNIAPSEYDLVPGLYEGGFKVWEGSVDLVNSLLTLLTTQSPREEDVVIELGCGLGLPTIAALRLGYRHALLSDFNADVLATTWGVLQENLENSTTPVRSLDIHCLAGDWLGLSKWLHGSIFEHASLILSAETLYNTEVCEKVFVMVKTHLKVGGQALIASKKYYFGVGGGTLHLEELVKRECSLRYEVFRRIDDGKSNLREVILLTRIS